MGFTQKKTIELLPGTQKFSYDDVTGAQKLVGGGVNLNYEGNKLYADSLFYYESQKLVKAFGRVNIIKNDSLNLHCDRLVYQTDKHLAKLYDHVRVIDNNYLLTTDLLDYNAKSGLASYQSGGKIENLLQKEVLTSRRGYLYPNEKNMAFSENVKYISDSIILTTDTLQYRYLTNMAHFYGKTQIEVDSTEMFCHKGWFNTKKQEGVLQDKAYVFYQKKQLYGDSLYVDKQHEIVKGKNNLHFIDTTNKVEVNANLLSFIKSEHFGYITDRAMITYYTNQDTIYLHSDSIYIYTDSLDNITRTELFHQVQSYSSKFQSSCDSMVINRQLETTVLYKDPIVWSQNAELKADTIRVFANDSLITKAELLKRPTVIMELDSGKYYNQIGGQTMEAFFVDNKLKRVEVNKNAQTNYFPQDTLRSDTLIEVQRKGMARLYASRIKVYLDSGEVIGITYYDSPDGAFYPLMQIPNEEQFIKNFLFLPQFRPQSREDIFVEKRKYQK